MLDDVAERLRRTRWPVESGEPWERGTDLAFLRDLTTIWAESFDWRSWERRFAHYSPMLASVGDTSVHILLELGSGPDPLPIILTHGWPGSVVELIELIDPLADPERYGGRAEDGFTVVVPSLPGFGFSPAPPSRLGPREVAALWHELMTEALGFDRYVAHGGDIGAAVTAWLGVDHADTVAAIHATNAVLRATWTEEHDPLGPEELEHLEQRAARGALDGGYQLMHAHKPATVGFSLADSPAGLAAWVVGKFQGWTVPGSTEPPPFPLDHLVANVMTYWIEPMEPAHWMYQSLADGRGYTLPAGRRVESPTYFCFHPRDISVGPPDAWLRRAYTVGGVTRRTSGGHFPGIEGPSALADGIRQALRAHA